MRDASKRRRVSITRAITLARRPLVDPSADESRIRAVGSGDKSLEIEEADARTRTADPFITRHAAAGAIRHKAAFSAAITRDRALRGACPRRFILDAGLDTLGVTSPPPVSTGRPRGQPFLRAGVDEQAEATGVLEACASVA
jgi:hypothetical protein